MLDDYTTRTELEKQILLKERKLAATAQNYDGLSGETLEEFIEAWFDLASYCQAHDETVLSIPIFDLYLKWIEILRSAADAMDSDDIRDAFEGLQAAMNKILMGGWSALNREDNS